MAVYIAIIGKDNSPFFTTCMNQEDEMQLQYNVYITLDFIEERINTPKSAANEPRDMYLGLLYSTQHHKFYSYITNTKMKFVLAIPTGNMLLRDNEIKGIFCSLHTAYADAISNPFYMPPYPIISKKFEENVNQIMQLSSS